MFIVLLCFAAIFLVGYAGGITSLNAAVGKKAPLEFRAMALVTIVVLTTAIFQTLPRILLAFLLSFCGAVVVHEVFRNLGLLQLSDSAPSFSVNTFIAIAFGLGTSTISFLGIRFVLALTDIVFLQTKPLKLLGILIAIFAAFSGSLAAISGELEAPNSEFRTLLTVSSNARMLVMASGTVYGLSLAMGGWLANVLRGTPWRYPSSYRQWAIAVGSWWGTSFLNLDLSDVNFRGTKLANTDFRARKLYRTCFQGAIGLERARVDNQYLDLEHPKVQRLLTHGSSRDQDFRGFNLQGAYLQNADMRGFDLTDTNLTGADFKGADLRDSILIRTQLTNTDFQGVDLRKNVLIDANLTEADLRGADLRGSILVRAQVARANFTGADLTGICIEDWSVSSKTRFTDVRCDYIFRKYQDGQPSDRYPIDRNFEPGEFASLFAEPEDEVELVFKGEFNIAALSLALYKLQTDTPELDLELRGVEQRGKLWVAKIKSTSSLLNEQLIQERLTSVYQDPSNGNITVEETIKNSIYRDYEETKHRLAESEQLIRQLAGVTGNQAEALKELSKQSFGNNFFISGSTITNLAGSGQIEYREAASSIRSLVTNRVDPRATLQGLIDQLNAQNVATTSATQRELIQQVLVSEANQDPKFKEFLLQQGQQIISSVSSGEITIAVRAAISTLRNSE
ncbi:pentapeptide repeat-containing protein [Leptolyngbya sp. AS-A5]